MSKKFYLKQNLQKLLKKKIKKYKKPFNKVKFLGLKIYEVNNFLYKKIINQINKTSFKVRRSYIYRINKLYFNKNLRLYKCINSLKNEYFLNIKINSLTLNLYKFIFFKYSWTSIIALQYGQLLDFHLELLRRKFRQNLYRESLIQLCISPYKILLKRPNQIRMGTGKGFKIWKIIYPIFPGLEILRIKGNSYLGIKKLFLKIEIKIPFKMKCISISRI